MKEISRALLEKPQAFPKLLPLKTEQIGPSFSQTLIWIQEKSKALDSMTDFKFCQTLWKQGVALL